MEVCSGGMRGNDCFTVDINPEADPALVDDGQELSKVTSAKFDRWRCDPSYNFNTAEIMFRVNLEDLENRFDSHVKGSITIY